MNSPDRQDVSSTLAGIPLFGEWNQREFDSSPWPMRIFDHETLKYLAVNDAALKLYGYTREDYLALTARDTRHPDEHPRLVASLSETTGFMRYRGPRRHLKKSGEIIVVEVVTQDVIYDGRLARLAMTIDVTDRVRMQQLLFKREQEFESLAENLPDLVARFDREHRYLYINAVVEAISGMPRTHFIGKTMREAGLSEELVRAYDGSLAQVFATGNEHEFEVMSDTPRGRRLFDARHVPELDAGREVATVLCVTRDITERKKAERELLESRQRLAWILNVTGVGTWMNPLPLGKLNWDSRTRELFFVPPGAEPTVELFWRRLHPEDREPTRLAVETAIRDRRLYEIDHRVVNPATGEIRWIRSAGKATYAADGTAFLFDGINYDVTDRKRTEDSLRETNEFMRGVIESSRDCIKVIDLEGRLQSMSEGGQRLMEIDDIQPLLKKSWIEFWKDADREAAAQALDAARDGGTGSFEGYCPTAKGTPKWWDVMVSPILDAAGKPKQLLAVSRDITRRRKIHDELRENEERFRLIAENIREVFWISNPRGDNLYVSPGYEEIWGRSRASLYGNPRSWMESIHPDDLPAVRDCLAKMARGERTSVEYRIARPDGSVRWIMDRSYPMLRSDGTRLVCGIAEDITGLKLAEQERLAHGMRQRDALVREVRHRIKNSLQGVAGLLRQKVRKYPAIAPGIDEAIAQLQSVALVYGLQETRPDGLIALSEIMNEICASAEGLTGGTVEKARDRKSRRPACVAGAEAVSVAVALNELVFNALKHQTGAGRKRARVTLLESKDSAEIRIANRGKLPKGFDFPAGRGVGDGLGLVRTLLAPPGGEIAFNGGRNEVEVVVKLVPPLLAQRQQAITR